jgi:hypothetical protein
MIWSRNHGSVFSGRPTIEQRPRRIKDVLNQTHTYHKDKMPSIKKIAFRHWSVDLYKNANDKRFSHQDPQKSMNNNSQKGTQVRRIVSVKSSSEVGASFPSTIHL